MMYQSSTMLTSLWKPSDQRVSVRSPAEHPPAGQPPEKVKVSIHPESEAFHASLRQARSQLRELTNLMDLLASQHENALSHVETTRYPAGKELGLLSKGDPTESELPVDLSAENAQERTLSAIECDEHEQVQELLTGGMDPNTTLRSVTVGGLNMVASTPLVLAVKRGNGAIVKMLLQAGADPNAEYSFAAGAEQILWSGPAVHAVIPTKNLNILQDLVKYKANIHASSSTGANLVWQAAYFGASEILQYLLDWSVEKECMAQSQDDVSLSLSPLHAAAKAGNSSCVAALLKAKASFQVDDGSGASPLSSAVNHGHAGVVQLLVSHHADVFKPSPFPIMESCDRLMDSVFASNNPALIGAVAKGLRHTPRLPNSCTRADFIHFLSVPGDAPYAIWNAVFRHHKLGHWETTGDRRRRIITSAAHVDERIGFNITVGPDKSVLDDYFKAKEQLPPDLLGFKARLTRERVHNSKDLYEPVNFFACHMPFVHEDLEVILAIADCNDRKVFGAAGCRAILELMWRKERMGAQGRMIMAFIEVMNLVAVNIILNITSVDLAETLREGVLQVAVVLAFLVWVVVSFVEMSQAIGYCSHGLVRRYLSNKRYIFDIVVLVCTGLVIFWTWWRGMETTDSPAFRILLGVVVGLKWTRLLMSLRQLKSVGLRILPIMDTMWDLGPFLFVLSVYFVGAVNMLYALGNHSVTDAFLIIYRLVVLGDVNMGEMERGTAKLRLRLDSSGTFEEEILGPSDYRVVVRALMLSVSFVMGVSMMNLFVAMLCVSYSQAAERAPLAFERSRAHIVLDQYAARKGLRCLLCQRRDRLQSQESRLPHTPQHTWDNLRVLLETSIGRFQLQHSAHVWFALPWHEDEELEGAC